MWNLATKDNDHNVHSCYSNTAGQLILKKEQAHLKKIAMKKKISMKKVS